MHVFRLAFQGHRFAGTALQPGQRTVQGRLREILAQLDDGREVLTRTCGRLDAGVGAEQLVLHAHVTREWDCVALAKAINGHLQGEAQVVAAASMPDDWDALSEPSTKTYRYTILQREVGPDPDAALWHHRRLDHTHLLPAMARSMVGRHDLSAFAALRNDESDLADGTRDYLAADWRARPAPGAGTLWQFRITGTGFLYRQVRGLVGAQIAVARGKATLEQFLAAIDAGRDYPRVGQVAPAEGLVLEAVSYQREPEWQSVR